MSIAKNKYVDEMAKILVCLEEEGKINMQETYNMLNGFVVNQKKDILIANAVEATWDLKDFISSSKEK